tara:strand:+ start:203 stop:706 length:504 start_codon:yes stop_codon:yes gene_type:complete
MKTVEELLAELHLTDAKRRERYEKFFPESDDLIAVVLRGHMLVEEILEAILNHHAIDNKALAGIRLSFEIKHKLAHAFLRIPSPPEMWLSIRALNRLRNKLAHVVEPENLQGAIHNFIQHSTSKIEKDPLADENDIIRVRASLGYLLGQLSVLEVASQYMESRRQYA